MRKQVEEPPSRARSEMMRSVRTRNTAPEASVRAILDDLRLPYEQNVRSLPGSPDMVIGRKRIIIFVHGCFWHGHRHCLKGVTRPKTRASFWSAKIDGNVLRDRAQARRLRRSGWSVLTLWECQCARPNEVRRRIERFVKKRKERITDGH